MRVSLLRLLSLVVYGSVLAGCNKLVDVDAPQTSTNADIVYKSDATAIAALNNIYTLISQGGVRSGVMSTSLFCGLSADELSVYAGSNDQLVLSYFRNTLTATNTVGSDLWSTSYPSVIFSVNSAIEGLSASTNLSESIKRQLLGEAKFIRAFCYFYLVNCYGDVPLVLNTDYKQNSAIGRNPKLDVYKQIIADLKDAQGLLSDGYLNSTLKEPSDERTVPNKWAATALLARAYLFIEDWASAESEANTVIAKMDLYDTVNVNNTFLVNNKEALWQIQSVSSAVTNTPEARLFILPDTGPDNGEYSVYLKEEVVNSFDATDRRMAAWTKSVTAGGKTYYFPSKYKNNELFSPTTERSTVLRLSEQYLIRSEAKLRLSKSAEAVQDINVIRFKAGLQPYQYDSPDALLEEIMKQRRLELFTEWGHRWLDLKRWKVATTILKPVKGANWQDTDELYPIPLSEIQKNIALKGQQNPGY